MCLDCILSFGIIEMAVLNVCPFDNTAVAVSGKVERSLTGLTTPVG